MIDGHCHILPDCDDGSQNIEQSINMLKAAKDCGIDKIIFTSHIKDHYAGFDYQKQAYEKIFPYAQKLNIKTALGAEINWKQLSDVDFGQFKEMTLGNSNLFLLELSSVSLTSSWETIIYKLLGEGYKVIIAHPERYHYVHEDMQILDAFIDAGCLIMMSGTSLCKPVFGPRTFKCAKKMLKLGLVDIIASDAHTPHSYQLFLKALKFGAKFGYNTKTADTILDEAF